MAKHKGATKKASRSSSSKILPKLPNFGTLAFGSLIGIFVTSVVFYLFSTTDLTLKIPANKANLAEAVTEPQPMAAASAAPEPHFDFYTELSNSSSSSQETRTVVPDLATGTKTKIKAITMFWVQAGSFKNKAEADELRASLTLNGLDAKIETAKLSGANWHRVILGPHKTESNAKAQQQLLKTYDITAIVLERG